MDTSRFDRLTTLLATVGSRRTLALLLAMLPLGNSHLGHDADAAKRRRRRPRSRSRDRVTQEKKKKKLLCFNRETILAKKKEKKKLLKQGATLGECPPSPPSPPPPSPPAPPPPPPPPPPCGWNFSAQIGAGVRGSGTNQFNNPDGVAVSPDGLTAWVADSNNSRVMVWTRPNASSTNWSFNTQIGAFGSSTDQFAGPDGVAVSPDGLTIWVVDQGNYRVMVWTRPNASSTAWSFNAQIGTGTPGPGTDQFSVPYGVAISPDGLTVWVTDSGNSRVVVWTRPNGSSTNWSFNAQIGTGVQGSGTDQFEGPRGVAVTADGLTVWVSDHFNHRVMVWTRPNGSSTSWSFSTQIGAGVLGSGTNQFAFPNYVAVSPDSLNVWVVDQENNRVMIWARPNASSTSWSFAAQIGAGVRGSGTNQLNIPHGVAISPDGLTAWVSDLFNHRVMVWKLEVCQS